MLHKERTARTLVVTIDRPDRRNAVDVATAKALFDAFMEFDGDDALDVAILTGAGGHFCAGADLQAVAAGEARDLRPELAIGPMGPTRMRLRKPVIAAIEGYAVAGGLELAVWCDLRVAGESSTLGVFCRRFGVPLIDLGTVRLPRLIGQGHAADLILTGRAVGAAEALGMGLVNRVVADGTAEIGMARFDGIESGAQSNRSIHLQLNLAVYARKRAQMIGQEDADHGSVWASTERTAGRSRTSAVHVSPLSGEA